jgi:hypothetical protein
MNSPHKPYPPYRQDQKYTEEPLISKELVTNDDRDLDEYLDEWKGSHSKWKEGDSTPELAYLEYDNPICSLAELMAKIPSGVSPADVFISLHRDRMIDYVEFSVKIRKPTDPVQQQKEFDQAQAEYQKAEVQYQKDLLKYNEWFAANEIAKKEKEILNLKKDLKKLKK